MNDLPLVSCIMPTRNRPGFVARAVDCFLKQDYPNKQLIIFEEESDSLGGLSLMPKEVDYHRTKDLHFKSIGEKRNAMCMYAEGDLVAHWDDDDWHSPKRLSTQVERMRADGSRLSGMHQLVFYNGERAWLFQTVRKPWLAGGTLVYERSLWLEQHFTEVSNGEDVAFIDAAYKRGVKISAIDDPSLYVARLHESNTTQRTVDSQWGGFDVNQVRKWIGEPC